MYLLLTYLQVIFFCDEHGLQGVQGPLLLLVGHKHSPLLAVKCPVHTGDRSKLIEEKEKIDTLIGNVF